MDDARVWMRTQEEHTGTELASELRMSLVDSMLNLKYMEEIKTGC